MNVESFVEWSFISCTHKSYLDPINSYNLGLGNALKSPIKSIWLFDEGRVMIDLIRSFLFLFTHDSEFCENYTSFYPCPCRKSTLKINKIWLCNMMLLFDFYSQVFVGHPWTRIPVLNWPLPRVSSWWTSQGWKRCLLWKRLPVFLCQQLTSLYRCQSNFCWTPKRLLNKPNRMHLLCVRWTLLLTR